MLLVSSNMVDHYFGTRPPLIPSQEALVFICTPDFLCPPTAATMDMMYWETGHVKMKQETFHLYAVLLPFFPIGWAGKILPEQECHLAYFPG